MSDLSFWNQWRKTYRYIYILLLGLLIMVAALLVFLVISGNSFAFSWELLQKYTSYELPLRSISLLAEEIPVNVDHYLVEETFQGSNIIIHPGVYAALGILSLAFLAVAITILSSLSRFWYLFGMTLIALMLAGLRFEQIMLFQSTENFGLYLAILLYLPLSYYFNSINKNVALSHRFVWFFVVSLILGLILYFFSAVGNAFVYMGSYGILVPLLLSLVFIFLVSHDIISWFINVITGKNTPNSKNSLLHYSLLSSLYLGWLLLTYLHNINYVNWDIIYINPAVLVIISTVYGIWEFRYRSGFIYSFIPFSPSGAILYLCLGIVSLVTLGAFYVTANDPMLGMYEDFIIFSHLGVGFMFFLYTIGNFAGVLQKNFIVYKVLYKPKNLPYFTTSIGGIIVIAVLVARSILYPYYQGTAGYYNVLGDLFASEEQLFLSEQYYKLARSFDVTNHKSNYSLASLAIKQGDEGVALKYFDDAIAKFPNEYAYVNVANIYQEKGRFFDALFTLNEGLKNFPGNPYLQNNLGVLYRGSSVLDSAMYYLQRAGMNAEVKKSADVNILVLSIENKISLDVDSLRENLEWKGSLSVINNTLIYLSTRKAPVEAIRLKDIDLKKGNLDAESFTFWHEYTLNQQYSPKGNNLDSLLSVMAEDNTNQNFQSELLYLAAISQYKASSVWAAFQSLKELRNISVSGTGYYSYILGMWALEQHAYKLASEFFSTAAEDGYKLGGFPPAVANTMSGNVEEADFYWNMAIQGKDPSLNETATLVKKWLYDQGGEASAKKDRIAYIKVFFSNASDVPELLGIASDIADNTLQIEAYLTTIQKALENENLSGLNSLVDLLERKELSELQEKEFIKLKVAYYLASNQYEMVEKLLTDSLVYKSIVNSSLFIHFQAKKALKAGNTEAAGDLFDQLAEKNPFYEQGIKDAAIFFNAETGGGEKAYQILLEALNINPYSPTLHKAYVLQSLEMQLSNYAINNLDILSELLQAKEYKKFLFLYSQKRDSLEQVQDQWD